MSKAKTLISETPADPFIGRKIQFRSDYPGWVIESVSGEGETVLHMRSGHDLYSHAIANDAVGEFFVKFEVKEVNDDSN